MSLLTNFIFFLTVRVLNRSGPLICDRCGSKHPSRKAFRLHYKFNHRDASFFCDLCPQSCIQKQALMKHIEGVHLKLQPFQCKDCKFKTSYKNNFKSHIRQHGPKTECHKFATSLSKIFIGIFGAMQK